MDRVAILGNFDGVHMGHQRLIKKAIDFAKKNGYETVVYTFSTLPNNKKYIMTVTEKINEIKKLGVDKIFVDDFYNVKNYTPSEFVTEILMHTLKVKKVFCGYNYTFGVNKSGNIHTLSKLIDTTIVDEIKVDDIITSSSVIRSFLEQGNIELANKLLGKAYKISGVVIHGKKLGRTIGFPTANIRPNALKVSIPLGVYGVKLTIDGDEKVYTAIMNIGKNPTVNTTDTITAEANILDFNEDIYGKSITISILKMLRHEKKFDSLEQLKEQISSDKKMWRSIADDYNQN